MIVVDLDSDSISSEDLKKRLLEAEGLIHDLRTERDALQQSLVDKAGLNESVIIERSKRVSTQETRIFRRDMTVLEEDVKQKAQQIRHLQDRCSQLEVEKKQMEEVVRRIEEDKQDQEKQLTGLRLRFHDLEKQMIQKSEDIYQMTSQIQMKTETVNDLRKQFETTMAEMNLEKKILEEKLMKAGSHVDQENRVISEVRQLSNRLECLTPVKKAQRKEQEEYLQLSAKVIEETMESLKTRNRRLEKELEEKKQVLKVTREELETLQKTMKEAMGDSEQASRYLQEENMKITRQKADIRCDLLEARRQLESFDRKKEELEKQRDEALEEVTRLQNQKKSVEKELQELQNLSEERQTKIEELQTKMAGLEVMKREHDAMRNELSRIQEKFNECGRMLVLSDTQFSQMKSEKEQAERSRRRAIEQCNELVGRVRSLEASLENQRKVEQEVETLRAENSRQAQKLEFMKEEIQEVHADYRQELSTVAARHQKSKSSSEDVEPLRLQLSQKESQLRSAKKTIDEIRADNRKVQEMLDECRRHQEKILEENVRLRKGMADALAKIEEYKRNWQNSEEKAEKMEEERRGMEKRIGKMEEEIQEKTQQIQENEETIAALHSQINARQTKQQPKLGRRSTLLSTVSEMDTSVYMREAEEMRSLEEQRSKLMSDLAEKRRLLSESKSKSTANTTTVIHTTTVTSTETASSKSATELRPPAATMRHDIPHKWKEFRHLGVLSMKCSLCFVGIPTLGKTKRCVHCDVQVHASCAPRVNNTCGMPVQCATYYQQNQTTVSAVSEGRMNGWLRVYSDDQPGATWIASWAMMDLTRIAFYTNDGADLDKPFLWIDLNQEQWVLRTGQEMPVDCDDSMRASNVLMIKMPRRSLYILAPSQPAAGRWAECLQTAQRKRMMLNSKAASIAEFTCLLVLNSPNNLKIFKALVRRKRLTRELTLLTG
uniref:Phorbol-ester/DAG-type domain-containing protein n=1 Tax=Caenorhabditis tropicalis TaxID=1561998 RepID=A0A1I7UKP4_9PELO